MGFRRVIALGLVLVMLATTEAVATAESAEATTAVPTTESQKAETAEE